MKGKKISIFFVMLLVLSIFVIAEENWAPSLPNDGGNNSSPPADNPTYTSTLQITQIKAKVDGKSETITSNNEKISKDAKESSDVEFNVEVRNIWDRKIKGISVTATIENIDNSDDLEEDGEISDLDPGDSDDVSLDFSLPLKVDDGSYDVKVRVEGEDNDNELHVAEWKLTLEVKKDSHNVRISKASVSPSTVSCSGSAALEFNILNLGRDEEEINLEVKNDYLGVDYTEENIDLGTGTDDDAEYEKALTIRIPDTINAGVYPLGIKADYNDGKSTAEKTIYITVGNCASSKQTKTSTKMLPPGFSETIGSYQSSSPSETIIYPMNDSSMILLLSTILIVVLGLIIFLLGAIIIRLRK